MFSSSLSSNLIEYIHTNNIFNVFFSLTKMLSLTLKKGKLLLLTLQ